MTSSIVPVLLVLAQTIFISSHFTGFLPENRQRENNRSLKWSFSFFRWLVSTCFSAQWQEYSHYRQYPLTGGKLLVLGIKYTRNQVHKDSCTQGFKYKVSRCNGSRARRKYDHFSIVTVQLHLKFETCTKKEFTNVAHRYMLYFSVLEE